MSESRQAAWRRRRSSSRLLGARRLEQGVGPGAQLGRVLGRTRARAARTRGRRTAAGPSGARSPTAGCRAGPRECRTPRSAPRRAAASSAAAPAPARRRAAPRAAAGRSPRCPCMAESFLALRISSQKSMRLRGRHGVAVHDAQRIVGRAPCAAWRWRARCRRRRRRRGRARRRARGRGRSARRRCRSPSSMRPPEASIRRKPPSGSVADWRKRVAADVDELEAAAAEVAGEAVGRAEAHQDAVGGKLGLALAGEDAGCACPAPARRGR